MRPGGWDPLYYWCKRRLGQVHGCTEEKSCEDITRSLTSKPRREASEERKCVDTLILEFEPPEQ